MINVMWQPGITLEELEKKVIQSAMKFYQTQVAASEALGIAPRTLQNKLGQYAKEAAAPIKRGETIQDKVDAENRRINALRTQGRFRVESDLEAAKKYPVSLREQAKIQEVLSKQIAAGAADSKKVGAVGEPAGPVGDEVGAHQTEAQACAQSK